MVHLPIRDAAEFMVGDYGDGEGGVGNGGEFKITLIALQTDRTGRDELSPHLEVFGDAIVGQSARPPDDGVCSECDGTRRVEEGCCCYQCEYDDSAHRRLVPCLACPEGLFLAEMEEYEAYGRARNDA